MNIILQHNSSKQICVFFEYHLDTSQHQKSDMNNKLTFKSCSCQETVVTLFDIWDDLVYNAIRGDVSICYEDDLYSCFDGQFVFSWPNSGGGTGPIWTKSHLMMIIFCNH